MIVVAEASAAQPLPMPKLGLTMTEGTVAKWVAQSGAAFAAGDTLVLVETDKVTYEVEAPSDGELLRILVQEGDTVPIGTALGEWQPVGPRSGAARDDHTARPEPTQDVPYTVRIIATPLARNLARDLRIDLKDVVPSGPRGRIKEADVRRAAALSAKPAAAGRDEQTRGSAPTPPGHIARLIAERMIAAKRDIPHFYLTVDIEVSRLLALRRELNELPQEPKVTITHLLIAAVRRVLLEMPEMNAVWDAGEPCRLRTADVGLAVETDRGLMNPVLRGLGGRFHDLVRKANAAIERARTGRLAPGDVGDAAITISNAGSRNLRYMTSIIVPGQSAILGIGSVQPCFRPDAAGLPALYQELGIVLSADHRIHSGIRAADFLERLRSAITRPACLIVGSAQEDAVARGP